MSGGNTFMEGRLGIKKISMHVFKITGFKFSLMVKTGCWILIVSKDWLLLMFYLEKKC